MNDRKSNSKFSADWSLMLVILWALCGIPALLYAQKAVNAAPNSPAIHKIQLKKGFFKPYKFSYGGNTAQNVYNSLGTSFTPEFKRVISLHPEAFQEAKKAIPYNVAAIGGYALLMFSVTKLFIDTLNQKQQLSRGEISDNGSSGLGLTLISLGVIVPTSLLGQSKLKKAIKIFNNAQLQSSRLPNLHNFPYKKKVDTVLLTTPAKKFTRNALMAKADVD